MTGPMADIFAQRACPELAAILRARLRPILQRWEVLVRQVLAKADQLTRPQLWDDAPKVLEQVARSLESDRLAPAGTLADASGAHGVVRFDQNFDISELLIEYNLLRSAMLGEIMENLGRPIESFEAVALNAALDVMSRRSVQTFVDKQSQELKAATEAQSKYLSFLSHDLRGGLNGIFLMIEVLRREIGSDPRLAETIGDLDVMRRALLETVGTMDRFLHAERFRKGKVQLRPGRIHLGNLLSETVSNFGYQARDKGLVLRLDVPSDCTITSDRELLGLIFQNLLSNAVKYTDKGEILVTTRPTQDGGFLISVKDQGPGIAPERLEELFSAYTRGETHGQPGMGLGLSIARQAAEYLGARLWAESTLGKGSTFHVQLPRELPARPPRSDAGQSMP